MQHELVPPWFHAHIWLLEKQAHLVLVPGQLLQMLHEGVRRKGGGVSAGGELFGEHRRPRLRLRFGLALSCAAIMHANMSTKEATGLCIAMLSLNQRTSTCEERYQLLGITCTNQPSGSRSGFSSTQQSLDARTYSLHVTVSSIVNIPSFLLCHSRKAG